MKKLNYLTLLGVGISLSLGVSATASNQVFNNLGEKGNSSNPEKTSALSESSEGNEALPPQARGQLPGIAPKQKKGTEESIFDNFNPGSSNTKGSPKGVISKELDKAISTLEDLINNDGIDTEFDESDGSLNFRDRKGNLFWITFAEPDENGVVLYTLHQQSIRPEKGDDVKENLIYAAEYMTANSPYQSYYVEDSKGGKIEMTFPVYAATPEGYYSGLSAMQKTMSGAKELYQAGLKAGKEYNDKLHYEWSNEVGSKTVMEVPKGNEEATIEIKKVDFKALGKPGKENEEVSLTESEMVYLIPEITFMPIVDDPKKLPEGATIAVQIIDPDKNTMVYDVHSDYTQMDYIPIKNAKEQTAVLPRIGNGDTKLWKSGLYEIRIFENGQEIFNYQFPVQKSRK